MSALQRLKQEFKHLKKYPPAGIKASPLNEDNFLVWEITITCPTGSFYEGGEFVATLEFPMDYPMSPPKMKFVTPIFHPNVYQQPNTGLVCISTLHPPGKDPLGYENANERWNPTLNIEAIGRSVISILCAPNPDSPANPDAAIMFRENKDAFIERAKSCAMKSKLEADRLRLKKSQEEEFKATLLADQEKERRIKKEKDEKIMLDVKNNVENETKPGKSEVIGEKRKSEGQEIEKKGGRCVKRKTENENKIEVEVVSDEIKSEGEGNGKSKTDAICDIKNEDTSPGGRGCVRGETAPHLGGSAATARPGGSAPSLDDLRSRRLAFLGKFQKSPPEKKE